MPGRASGGRVDLTDRFCATVKNEQAADYFGAKTVGLGLRVLPSIESGVVEATD